MRAVPATTASLEPPPAFTMRPNKRTPGPMLTIPAMSDAILDPSERSYRPPQDRHLNDRPRVFEGRSEVQRKPTSLPQRGQLVRDLAGVDISPAPSCPSLGLSPIPRHLSSCSSRAPAPQHIQREETGEESQGDVPGRARPPQDRLCLREESGD